MVDETDKILDEFKLKDELEEKIETLRKELADKETENKTKSDEVKQSLDKVTEQLEEQRERELIKDKNPEDRTSYDKAFLIYGKAKAETLKEILGDELDKLYPAPAEPVEEIEEEPEVEPEVKEEPPEVEPEPEPEPEVKEEPEEQPDEKDETIRKLKKQVDELKEDAPAVEKPSEAPDATEKATDEDKKYIATDDEWMKATFEDAPRFTAKAKELKEE